MKQIKIIGVIILISLSFNSYSQMRLIEKIVSTAPQFSYSEDILVNGCEKEITFTVANIENYAITRASKLFITNSTHSYENVVWADVLYFDAYETFEFTIDGNVITDAGDWQLELRADNTDDLNAITLNSPIVPTTICTDCYNPQNITIIEDPTGTCNASLTVTYPNGGENFTQGQTITITYTSQNFSDIISIQVVRASDNYVVETIVDGVENTGSQSWTISNTFPNGEYKIKLYNTAGGSIVDYSDNAFTIENSTSGYNLTCSGINISPNPLMYNENADISAVVENTGDENFYGDIRIGWYWQSGNYITYLAQTTNLSNGQQVTLQRPVSPITSIPAFYTIKVEYSENGTDFIVLHEQNIEIDDCANARYINSFGTSASNLFDNDAEENIILMNLLFDENYSIADFTDLNLQYDGDLSNNTHIGAINGTFFQDYSSVPGASCSGCPAGECEHKGVDYHAPQGTNIFSPTYGKIIRTDDNIIAMYVPAYDATILFIHVTPSVSVGDIIHQNDPIGTTDNLNHLHFEFRIGENQNGGFTCTSSGGAGYENNFYDPRYVAQLLCENGNTNVSNISNKNIKIFPNPTNGIINIEFTENNIQKLTISDITGKQIIEKTVIQQNEQIDLSSFDSGIYIISIQTDNEIFTTKIIKE